MAARVRVTSLEPRDGRLWAGDRRVICHPADHEELLREVERDGSVDVVLARASAGRPPISEVEHESVNLVVRITPTMRARIDEAARAAGESAGAFVRRAIEAALQQPEE